jgi:MoxR-like ATPase
VSWDERNRAGMLAAVEAVLARLDGRPRASSTADAPALDALCRVFGLTSFERELLVLCAGVELEPRLADACVRAHGIPQATFGLGLALLGEPHWSALAPTAALRRRRLVEVGPGAVLTRAPLRIDERILHFLVGVPHLDARLDGLIEAAAPAGPLAPSHAAAARAVAAALGTEAAARIHLLGPAGVAKLDVAAAACERAGLRLFRLDAGALGAEPADLARLWEREAALTGGVLLADAERLDGAGHDALARFARLARAPLLVAAADLPSGLDDAVRVDVPPATPRERRALWHEILDAHAGDLNGELDVLADHFDLDAAAVRAVGGQASAGPGADLAERLWAACRVHARPRLDDLAERIVSAVGWDDLVVTPDARRTLEEIAAQVRRRGIVYDDWGFAARGSRGLGISALFAGPSGTGKTMAAEVLANALALDLHRIDLSSVVSKYIGETEKNLRRVFDAADRGGAVLLFDEADALFGRRTEVRDSHDRFANIEVSYLLQRMEAYRGLAILTTNRRDAIDEAFLRRLRFVVEFPFPDAGQRREIWRRAFPGAVPLAPLDLDTLAGLTVAGGNIRNIALGAAFLAADQQAPVGMDHLLRAARSEYAKLERSLASPELGAPA